MQEVFEKLIEKLEELKNEYKWAVVYESKHGNVIEREQAKEAANVTEKVIEIVKQVAAEYNNGWIPCSERLPEESTLEQVKLHNEDNYKTYVADEIAIKALEEI